MSNISMHPELYKAATTEHPCDIKIFDSNYIDHRQTTFHAKNNVLHLVSKFNQKEFAEKMIPLHPQLMHQRNYKGDTPLHIASRYGHLRIVELLIKGALEFDPQVIDIEEAPPRPRRNPIFGLLNDEKDTALHDAVRSGHLEVVKFLIDNDLESTKLCNGVGDSPLFLAVDRKFIAIALYITHNAPQCSYRGRDGMNVLHAAVIRTCGVSQTESLLELWVRHSKHPTAFVYEVLEEIRDIWTLPTKIIKPAWKTLKYKVLRVKKTEENPCSKLWVNHVMKPTRQVWLKFWSLIAYPCLRRKKSDIEEEENPSSKLWVKYVMKPIGQVWLGFWSLIAYPCLYRKKSDIEEEEYLRSLIHAFQRIIKEADNELQWTPLHYAAYLRHMKAINLLLEIDRNVVYEKDKEGMSALHIAAKEGHVEVIKQIIKCFPDTCESLDFRGRTILHVAVENGKYKVVDYILEKKAFRGLINEKDHGDGNTALHYAAIYGHRIILKMLVDDEKVDKGILNKQGLVAYTMVSDMELRFYQKSHISKKLDKKGGSPSLKTIVNTENSQTKDVEITNKDSDDLKNTLGDSDDLKNSLGVPKEISPNCQDIREAVGSTHIVVISIIASVTFAAGFQIPGGVDQGSSVSAASHNLIFATFQIANTLSLCSALAAIATYFSAATEKKCGPYKYLMWFASSLTYISIWSTGLSYIMGTNLVITKHPLLAAANLALFGCSVLLYMIVWFFR